MKWQVSQRLGAQKLVQHVLLSVFYRNQNGKNCWILRRDFFSQRWTYLIKFLALGCGWNAILSEYFLAMLQTVNSATVIYNAQTSRIGHSGFPYGSTEHVCTVQSLITWVVCMYVFIMWDKASFLVHQWEIMMPWLSVRSGHNNPDSSLPLAPEAQLVIWFGHSWVNSIYLKGCCCKEKPEYVKKMWNVSLTHEKIMSSSWVGQWKRVPFTLCRGKTALYFFSSMDNALPFYQLLWMKYAYVLRQIDTICLEPA